MKMGSPYSHVNCTRIGPKKCRKADVEVDNSDLTIKMSFSNLNLEFSTQVFNALFNSLGESIDTEEKYNIAKQLLLINRKLKVRKGLSKDLFKISNATFQTKFWNDGLLPYFSNIAFKFHNFALQKRSNSTTDIAVI